MRQWNPVPPILSVSTYYEATGQTKSGLLKMVIKAERLVKATPLHEFEAGAINPIPFLVREAFAARPGGF